MVPSVVYPLTVPEKSRRVDAALWERTAEESRLTQSVSWEEVPELKVIALCAQSAASLLKDPDAPGILI